MSNAQFYSEVVSLLSDASDTLSNDQMLQLVFDLGVAINAYGILCRRKILASQVEEGNK